MCPISHALAFLIVANHCEYFVNNLGKLYEEVSPGKCTDPQQLRCWTDSLWASKQADLYFWGSCNY